MSKIQYSGFVCTIKNAEWLEAQRVAGRVLNGAIQTALNEIAPGKSTKEINDVCENYILDHVGCSPTFKGYKGFPEASCISINNEIVHGIPRYDKVIQEGDVIKVDAGVTYCGAIADMARTLIVGKPKNIKHKMLDECCYSALNAAIKSIKPQPEINRLGTIGNAINKEAKKIGANIIIDMGGHGLELNQPHGAPFVSNVGERDDGPIIHAGMTLAIEPMFTFGSNKISVGPDKWTISLQDIGVHYEDTIFIHEDRVEIITR